MLQGCKQSVLCSYVFDELPKIYKLVCSNKPKKLAIKKKLIVKPVVRCDQCNFKSSLIQMKMHMKTVHGAKPRRTSKRTANFTPMVKTPKRPKTASLSYEGVIDSDCSILDDTFGGQRTASPIKDMKTLLTPVVKSVKSDVPSKVSPQNMSICSVSDDDDETNFRELLLTEKKHCVLCNFSTEIEEDLEKHRVESHDQQACMLEENIEITIGKPVVKPLPLYKCSECSFATITTDELHDHKKDKHRKEEPAISQAILHKCISCNFNTNDYAKLGVHIDSNHKPETSVTNPGQVLGTEQSPDDVISEY